MEPETVVLVESTLMAEDEPVIHPVSMNEQRNSLPHSDRTVAMDVSPVASGKPATKVSVKTVNLSKRSASDGKGSCFEISPFDIVLYIFAGINGT